MRYDLGRCIIERPRRGSSNRSLKVKAPRLGKFRLDADDFEDWEFDGPSRIPNSPYRCERYARNFDPKDFTDVLGPLQGYLRKSCGRPWDDVYSELAAGLGAFSWPLQHVMTAHLDVETNTYLGVDDKIYAENKHGNEEIGGYSWRDNFYVHPISRLLCKAEQYSHHYNKEKPNRWDTDRVKIDDSRWFVKIRGLWFIGTYRKAESAYMVAWKPQKRECYIKSDPPKLMYGEPEWPDFQSRYGKVEGHFIFTTIKSASKRELKKLRELLAKK